MNKRGHVTNALLLSVGIAVIVEGSSGAPTLHTLVAIGVPVTLGALVPDVDTAFGTHRKTLHNLPTLCVFVAFPIAFGNLHYVWIGVLTHYVLDLLGNVRGMALFYPWPEEYDVPVGISVDSRWAAVVTLVVTGVELAVVWWVFETNAHRRVLDGVSVAL